MLQSINLFPSNPAIPRLGRLHSSLPWCYSPASTNNVLTSVATWASSNVALLRCPAVPASQLQSLAEQPPLRPYTRESIGQTQLTVSCTVPPTRCCSRSPFTPAVRPSPRFADHPVHSRWHIFPTHEQQRPHERRHVGIGNVAIASRASTSSLATAVGCGTTTITASPRELSVRRC